MQAAFERGDFHRARELAEDCTAFLRVMRVVRTKLHSATFRLASLRMTGGFGDREEGSSA